MAAPSENGAGEKRKEKYRVLSTEYRAEESSAAFGSLDLADVAQLVEHSLGKGEVISSILIIGSRDTVVGRWSLAKANTEAGYDERRTTSGSERAGVTQW